MFSIETLVQILSLVVRNCCVVVRVSLSYLQLCSVLAGSVGGKRSPRSLSNRPGQVRRRCPDQQSLLLE